MISLVIIGIVAAITVPTLHANYTEQERISKIKKSYSTLANAMTRVKADGGSYILDYDLDDTLQAVTNWFDTYLEPYLITSKVCYNTTGCWTENGVYKLDGTKKSDSTSNGIGTPVVTAILNDGTAICIDRTTCSQFSIGATDTYCLAVYFDINGNKKPNTMGKDIFATVFTENGIVPSGSNLSHSSIEAACKAPASGLHCIMKYLKK